MSDIKYTPEQRDVIDLRNTNILVAAAAGSGKTAVLSQRIVALVSDINNPVDIDRLLIVTFTNAAAAEMRERINKELYKALEKIEDEELTSEDKNKKQELLIRQQNLLANAQITTIDSFCLYVVKNNFGDVDLEPGFRIPDEGEKKLLLKDTLGEILEAHYANMDEDFSYLVEAFAGGKTEKNLEQIILGIYNFVSSSPEPLLWLEKATQNSGLDSLEDMFSKPWWVVTEDTRRSLIDAGINAANEGLSLISGEDRYEKLKLLFQFYKDNLMEVKNSKDYGRIYRVLHRDDVPRLTGIRVPNDDLKQKSYALKDTAKNAFDALRNTYYVMGEEKLIEESVNVNRLVGQLCKLARELHIAFGELKKERGLVDFSDMEHYALNILTTRNEAGDYIPTKAALAYRDYYEAIMVDEYQDSNYVQEYILRSIAKDDNYFMVGDVKQSIYSFRHARPEIFQNKYVTFGDKAEATKDTKIDLNMNFRSRKEVLEFVNMIFDVIMRKSTAGLSYDDKASLKYGAKYYDDNQVSEQEYTPEVILIDSNENMDIQQYGFGDDDEIPEAMYIASRINEMIASGYVVYDKDLNVLRKLQYKDIVILLRDNKSDIYAKVLDNYGIPVFTNSKSGYFGTIEVRTVLNYLRIIDNPRQEIPLYGTMTSYFGGFKKEEIACIKANYPKSSLYDAIMHCIEDAGEYSQKVEAFASKLEEYRERILYIGVRQLIQELVTESGYLEYMTAFPGGGNRRANLETLMEKAGDYEKTSYHGLFRFIRYIEQLKEHEVDYGESGTLDEAADVVRIMTIHKSKGLEFPVCFLARQGDAIKIKSAQGSIVMDQECGLGVNYIDVNKRNKHKSVQYNNIASKIELEGRGEVMRLLYVALTRAREKLIVIGTVKNLEEAYGQLKCGEAVDDTQINQAKRYLDYTLMAISSNDKLAKYVHCLYEDDIRALVYTGTVKQVDRRRELEALSDYVDDEYDRLLNERFGKKYPHSNLEGLYTKTTVSEIKHSVYEENEKQTMFAYEAEKHPYIPSFMRVSEKKVVGTLKGNAYHRAMELIDFGKANELVENAGTSYSSNEAKVIYRELVQNTITEELASGRYSEEYKDLVDIDKCVEFLSSSLAMRMMKAAAKGKLYKEKGFFQGITANKINDAFPEDEYMLVQGVIDVYFEEDDKLVVADYKTDNVDDAQELVKRYKTQLDIYADALATITGKSCNEKIIYAFKLETEISL